ncbi:MAG: PilZ domain-containing protein [Candidatus Omnitrophica bacterium]|nr:PilZ domain-containing protein [Candidatus Omnitrophota bacterium]MBU2063670.1 PilZ domain-containing protein [Candidatus Omnitrophota bacterium]
MDTDNVCIDLRPLDPHIWHQYWQGLECLVNDISLVGAGVYSKEKLPVGTHLSIDLKLNGSPVKIRIFGKIIWAQQEDKDKFRTGISFSGWSDDKEKKRVYDFIEHLSAEN